jgi:hypothetical protein
MFKILRCFLSFVKSLSGFFGLVTLVELMSEQAPIGPIQTLHLSFPQTTTASNKASSVRKPKVRHEAIPHLLCVFYTPRQIFLQELLFQDSPGQRTGNSAPDWNAPGIMAAFQVRAII